MECRHAFLTTSCTPLQTRRCALQSLGALALSAGMVSATPTPKTSSHIREAQFWHREGKRVVCELCPHQCRLAPGATGICRVRTNTDMTLFTHGYGNPCAVHVDPIEKKPLYHVLPGSRTYSIAVAGCNLRCLNCQNHTISQVRPDQTRVQDLPPAGVVAQALHNGAAAVAYTYSEPIVWYEYMADSARLAREAGLRNLWITAGYINPAPLAGLTGLIDAANIDLKGFDEKTYRTLNGASLQPVQDTLVAAQRAGMWIELTVLLIPQWSDDMTMITRLCGWVREALGPGVPVHFSRFFPMYKLAYLSPTPPETLEQARRIAIEAGMHHVYIGNVAGVNSDTVCAACAHPLIRRSGYVVKTNDVIDGRCRFCAAPLAGIWRRSYAFRQTFPGSARAGRDGQQPRNCFAQPDGAVPACDPVVDHVRELHCTCFHPDPHDDGIIYYPPENHLTGSVYHGPVTLSSIR